MRILHVIHRYPPAIGGGEFWCAGLAAWQAAQGHDVEVLTLRATEDDELWGPERWRDPDAADVPRRPGTLALGRFDRRDGVAIRRCTVDAPNWALGRLLARRGLESLAWGHSAELYGCLLRAARWADVVHGYWLSGVHALAALAAARLARRRYVVTPFFHAGYDPHESPAARGLLRCADAVLALTAAEVEALHARGVPRNRIVLAGNAVAAPAPRDDPRRVRADLRIDEGARVLCYVGRKAPNKGLDVLFAALARTTPAAWLVLAGPATEWYRDMLARADRSRIVDLPSIDERAKFDLLRSADTLVLPSRLESFGSVFLEAWAAGTAVIGADVGPVREVVGDAGLLFRPDDADDLARAIRTMLDDDGLRREAVLRGAERLKRHSWDVVGPRVLAAYEAPSGGPA